MGMRISIRRKIALSFSVFILISGLIWVLTYYTYYLIGYRLEVIGLKNDVLNTILEARRYEKNYFLYGDKKNIEQALSYIRQAEIKLTKIAREYGKYALIKGFDEDLDDLLEYENSLAVFLDTYKGDGSLDLGGDEDKNLLWYQGEIRTLGRRITHNIEDIVAKEWQYVQRLAEKSRDYLVFALAAVSILSILTALYLAFNVNRPLRCIEDAIHKVAKGDYTNVPTISTGDEFESLVASLNNMINELNKRSEQLIQTEKLASLGTLTSGVAHELNNPLNNISTSCQILLEELEDDNLEYKRELLMETERQIERARDIVKGLLEFSKVRPFSLKTVNLRGLVDETIRLIKGEIPANISLKVEVPEGIRAEMDPRRIQQAMLNLILNGMQAMEDGGELTIKAWVEEDKGELYFQVQDTGKGIPEENLTKIFDPFFTTSDIGKGSGLGLSITHGIIEQHRGRIEVASELGKGTTFTVILPIGEVNSATV